MRSERNDLKARPLSIKQKLILTFFFLEIIIFPFIVAMQLEGGDFEPDPENRIVVRGLQIFFIWVPIAVILGFLLGRRLQKKQEIINFFRDHDVSPDEVAPIVGIFAPLAIIATVVVVWMAAISLRLFFITIPLYLIIRYWKKKGIRNLLAWIFRLVMKIAIRLKRLSYIGYFLPILFGSFFANNITKNTEAASGGTLILILIQMVVLVALWKFIRKPSSIVTMPLQQPQQIVQSLLPLQTQPEQLMISPSQRPLPRSTPAPVPQRTLPSIPPAVQKPPDIPPLTQRPLPSYAPRMQPAQPPGGEQPSPYPQQPVRQHPQQAVQQHPKQGHLQIPQPRPVQKYLPRQPAHTPLLHNPGTDTTGAKFKKKGLFGKR